MATSTRLLGPNEEPLRVGDLRRALEGVEDDAFLSILDDDHDVGKWFHYISKMSVIRAQNGGAEVWVDIARRIQKDYDDDGR